ncbi:MAG: hypothetical protein PHX99_07280 [Synergistaceae bacterium]|nr:hypothetical protein [Synergistaceae bacterium]
MAKIVTSDDFIPKPNIIQKSSGDAIIEGINTLVQNPIISPFIQAVTQLLQVTVQTKITNIKSNATEHNNQDAVLFSED